MDKNAYRHNCLKRQYLTWPLIHYEENNCRLLLGHLTHFGLNSTLPLIHKDVGRCFKTEDPIVKEKLKEKLINETIPFYMKKFGDIMKSNGGYLANGKLSWVELYVVGYSSSLPGLIGIDLTEKYPAFKELVNRVHSLPGTKEWVIKRPGLIGIDLTEKYPAFKELVDRVHSLPGIKEWVKKRPETAI